MAHDGINLGVFVIASIIGWRPGSWILWKLWGGIARYADADKGEPSKLATSVGGLERMFYIFAMMYETPEIVTGWLVMKAFFGWIREKKAEELEEFNVLVILNMLSLLIGLGLGLVANIGAHYLSTK